jgi:oxygen-independent coproporphyrinogen-3 oxidase
MAACIEMRTAGAGYKHYEVSAYAMQDRTCRHNLNYWDFGDYLGIGAGAHSKISFPHRIVRQVRSRQPESYIANARSGSPVAEAKEVPRAEIPFEFMLNALRLTDGVPPRLFAERTGIPISQIEGVLARAVARGLLVEAVDRLAPSPLGRRFLSDLQAMFLPAQQHN